MNASRSQGRKGATWRRSINSGSNGTPWLGTSPSGVRAPRRVDAPPELDPKVRDAALREAGIDPAYLEQAPLLRRLILGAAVAMGDGRDE